jgi:hypothetical protein
MEAANDFWTLFCRLSFPTVNHCIPKFTTVAICQAVEVRVQPVPTMEDVGVEMEIVEDIMQGMDLPPELATTIEWE